MKFLNKISFIFVFVFCFSITLVVLGVVQAVSGTIRLFNSDEEQHEKLQQYQIYNSDELVTKNNIRVTIGKKSSQTQKNTLVYIENTQSERDAALRTLPTEKAERIGQKVQDIILDAKSLSDEKKQSSERAFISPVEVQIKPKTSSMPLGYNSTIHTVLEGVFFEEVLWKFPLIIDVHRTSPRGQMANQSVTLSGKIRSLNEVAKVLVHELGHMVDIYFLRSSGSRSDVSEEFYTLSWETPTVIHSGLTESDFVSGYAVTNQYEDFAESFTMYIFHNTVFSQRAEESPTLQQKYDFFHKQIFGEYFLNTRSEIGSIPQTLWDVTKITIQDTSLKDIFALLGVVLRNLS